MWGLSDWQSWPEWELGGLPWRHRQDAAAQSAQATPAQAATPTLILNADHDRRCPIGMGTMYYRL